MLKQSKRTESYGRFFCKFILELFRLVHMLYPFLFRGLSLNCNLWFYFLKELHEYLKCNLVYDVIDHALFMLKFPLIIRTWKVYDRESGVNCFFVFGVINSGVIATINSQGKCIGFSAFYLQRCKSSRKGLETNWLGLEIPIYHIHLFQQMNINFLEE